MDILTEYKNKIKAAQTIEELNQITEECYKDSRTGESFQKSMDTFNLYNPVTVYGKINKLAMNKKVKISVGGGFIYETMDTNN